MQNQPSIYHHVSAQQACNRAILITGHGRSGTTIFGKIIHSMKQIEYVFEPPMLFSLLPLVSKLETGHFQLLFESYCFNQLLMGQITGREFNFNRNDDSCIYLTKTSAEIDHRLARAWTLPKAMAAADNSRLSIKLPGATIWLSALRRLYPAMTFIVLQREPNAVIQSAMKKSWFKDETLKQPDVFGHSQTFDFATPFWVATEDFENWRRWTELERAAYCFIRICEGALGVEGAIHVSYEELVSAPETVIGEVADRLGLEFGELTPRLIKETYARSEVTDDWIGQLSAETQEKIKNLLGQQFQLTLVGGAP